jgi:hypothetical protein
MTICGCSSPKEDGSSHHRTHAPSTDYKLHAVPANQQYQQQMPRIRSPGDHSHTEARNVPLRRQAEGADGPEVVPSVSDGIEVVPTVRDGIEVVPTVRDGIEVVPTVRDGIEVVPTSDLHSMRPCTVSAATVSHSTEGSAPAASFGASSVYDNPAPSTYEERRMDSDKQSTRSLSLETTTAHTQLDHHNLGLSPDTSSSIKRPSHTPRYPPSLGSSRSPVNRQIIHATGSSVRSNQFSAEGSQFINSGSGSIWTGDNTGKFDLSHHHH